MGKVNLGDKHIMKTGEVAVVVKYESASKGVTVEFSEGNAVVCSSKELRLGYVKNPLRKSVLGVACIGAGVYGAKGLEYRHWTHILRRAYCPRVHAKYPNYIGSTVCKEWHNFQNFAEWCQTAKGFSQVCEYGRLFCIDKDLLQPNNKMYGPDTCCFIPNCLNVSLEGGKKLKISGLPTGVFWHKASSGYVVTVSSKGAQQHVGCFKDVGQAKLEYDKVKRGVIVQLADKYKARISDAAYRALCSLDISERFIYD